MTGKKDTDKPYLIKLVRDRVDDHIGGEGHTYYAALPEELSTPLLQRKLVEEAVEYLVDPCLGELADTYAIIEELARRTVPGAMDAVRAEAKRKEEERGGFRMGIGMFNVVEPTDE